MSKPVANLSRYLTDGYKLFGVVALVAILVGLVCYLTQVGFYVIDRTWARPITIGPTDAETIESRTSITEVRQKLNHCESKNLELDLEIAMLKGKAEKLATYLETLRASSSSNSKKSPLSEKSELDASIALDETRLRLNQIALETKANNECGAEYQGIIDAYMQSPWAAGTEGTMTVLYIAYENVESIGDDIDIYGCRWGLIRCSKVGSLGEAFPGETSRLHPKGGSTRGHFYRAQLGEAWGANKEVLFVGKRPFWLF